MEVVASLLESLHSLSDGIGCEGGNWPALSKGRVAVDSPDLLGGWGFAIDYRQPPLIKINNRSNKMRYFLIGFFSPAVIAGVVIGIFTAFGLSR